MMKFSERKLRLIERLIALKDHEILEQIEELLIQGELEARAQESLNAIENGEFETLEEFSQKKKDWLKEKFKR
jgi:hypothetical protein